MAGHQCKRETVMSNSLKEARGKRQPSNKRNLAEHYGEIGIKAVAAAVRYGTKKNSRHARKEARPQRMRDMAHGE